MLCATPMRTISRLTLARTPGGPLLISLCHLLRFPLLSECPLSITPASFPYLNEGTMVDSSL